MRRTASRAHSRLPRMLMSNMRFSRATLISSTRCGMVHHAGVVHQAGQRAQFGVDAPNIASTCASSATSACTVMARRPARAHVGGHALGGGGVAGVVDRHVPAAGGGQAAVAAPMPRLAPVTSRTRVATVVMGSFLRSGLHQVVDLRRRGRGQPASLQVRMMASLVSK
jgi:hypothetical protein